MEVRTSLRWLAAITVVTIGAALAGCAESREARPDDTLPRITAASTSSTSSSPSSTPTTVFVPTSAPTTAPLPTQATAPPTPATLPPPPTQATLPQASGPTSTVVVTPGSVPSCSADAIGADTGDLTIDDIVCFNGWAIGHLDSCVQGASCDTVDVFHLTENGWIHDGEHSKQCAESLAQSGMSIYTAVTLGSSLCGADPGGATIIRPGTSGARVVQLQIALVSLGYDLDVDGRYGPRTQAAVRDLQSRRGLEVDGIAGSQTQAALGIGPGGAAGTPSTSPPAVTTTTTAAPAAGPTSTVVVTAGEPIECTVSAIAADLGRGVAEISLCVGGWASGLLDACSPGSPCEDLDVFHITEDGWTYDGVFGGICAEDALELGMSLRTANALGGTICGDPPPPATNILPGTTGPSVLQVQVALISLGYPIDADGIYGPRTQAAVRDFQLVGGLQVDGIAGPRTQAALGI